MFSSAGEASSNDEKKEEKSVVKVNYGQTVKLSDLYKELNALYQDKKKYETFTGVFASKLHPKTQLEVHRNAALKNALFQMTQHTNDTTTDQNKACQKIIVDLLKDNLVLTLTWLSQKKQEFRDSKILGKVYQKCLECMPLACFEFLWSKQFCEGVPGITTEKQENIRNTLQNEFNKSFPKYPPLTVLTLKDKIYQTQNYIDAQIKRYPSLDEMSRDEKNLLKKAFDLLDDLVTKSTWDINQYEAIKSDNDKLTRMHPTTKATLIEIFAFGDALCRTINNNKDTNRPSTSKTR